MTLQGLSGTWWRPLFTFSFASCQGLVSFGGQLVVPCPINPTVDDLILERVRFKLADSKNIDGLQGCGHAAAFTSIQC